MQTKQNKQTKPQAPKACPVCGHKSRKCDLVYDANGWACHTCRAEVAKLLRDRDYLVEIEDAWAVSTVTVRADSEAAAEAQVRARFDGCHADVKVFGARLRPRC